MSLFSIIFYIVCVITISKYNEDNYVTYIKLFYFNEKSSASTYSKYNTMDSVRLGVEILILFSIITNCLPLILRLVQHLSHFYYFGFYCKNFKDMKFQDIELEDMKVSDKADSDVQYRDIQVKYNTVNIDGKMQRSSFFL